MTEKILTQQVAEYLKLKFPKVIFHIDFGSGCKLTMGQAMYQKKLNNRAFPDLFIAEPRWVGVDHNELKCGLFIELKKDGTTIYKKDGTIVSNEHLREQEIVLQGLRYKGYEASWGIGFEQTRQIIDDYLK